MKIKKLLLVVSVLIMPVLAFAQYPTIPDSVNVRGEQQQRQWDALDELAWQSAVPAVMDGMLKGKPFVPWSSKPEDLCQATIPAFPGAEGGGKYSFGGRGGKVYVVTSLADSGPGTLREACESGGARIVVFNVAGEIHLDRPIHVVAPYISIYGQTAPGDGVVVTGQTVEIDTHDVIIRYMRFRRGAMDVAFRDDACGGQGIGNIIYDHCSASWGLDEVMSMYRHVYNRTSDGKMQKLPTVNITIQDCIFSEGLDLYNHAFGASIGGHNTYFVRNLFADNISRNPSIAMDGDFNFVNNVLFNWWNRSIDGGDDNSRFNIINNYLKPGPVTGYDPSKMTVKQQLRNYRKMLRKQSQDIADALPAICRRILKPEASRDKSRASVFGKAYVSGNRVWGNDAVSADNWRDGVQPSSKDREKTLRELRVDTPFPLPEHEEILSADEAYEKVLAGVGATKPVRDAVDERIIRGVRSGLPEYAVDALPHVSSYSKRRLPADSYVLGIITDPQQVGGLPQYKGEPRKDSDADGIPDEWESSHGLNPNDPSDSTMLREDGYMNIEWYANSN